MDYPNLKTCLRARPALLARGPIYLLYDEDGVDVAGSVAHALDIGFRAVILLTHGAPEINPEHKSRVLIARATATLQASVGLLARSLPKGTWIGYGYNSEYLYFPFCDHRTIGEMLIFHQDERRAAMVGMVVDLYAEDLGQHPGAVDRETACYDTSGYYALTREDPTNDWRPLERQVDIYGGLRWRFENHIPWSRRRIDRVMLLQAAPALILREDFTTGEPERDTIQCAWHRNLTCAMASFRTAKALRHNPSSRSQIDSFTWSGSRRFGWTGKALLDEGLMEPGQWF